MTNATGTTTAAGPDPGATRRAAGLARVRELGAADHGLAVLVTPRRPGPGTGADAAADDPAVSLVNAGVLPHPRTGDPVVAFVARGGTAKLANLRARPRATLVFRAGWEWVAVRGPVELAGPDDPLPGLADPERLRLLLREVYAAAGGNHPDPAEYDRVMAEDRRVVVLLHPERFSTNPPGAEHVEPADRPAVPAGGRR